MQINPPQDDPHFKLIQDEFVKQKQANVQFDQRISKAKYTTNKIDTNVDRISEILNHNSNESPPRSKKLYKPMIPLRLSSTSHVRKMGFIVKKCYEAIKTELMHVS